MRCVTYVVEYISKYCAPGIRLTRGHFVLTQGLGSPAPLVTSYLFFTLRYSGCSLRWKSPFMVYGFKTPNFRCFIRNPCIAPPLLKFWNIWWTIVSIVCFNNRFYMYDITIFVLIVKVFFTCKFILIMHLCNIAIVFQDLERNIHPRVHGPTNVRYKILDVILRCLFDLLKTGLGNINQPISLHSTHTHNKV